jgi:hypothetical protein
MKANHNKRKYVLACVYLVANIMKSKNESKSQLPLFRYLHFSLVANIMKSKNESKSQPTSIACPVLCACSKYHEIKDLSVAKARIPLKNQLLV